MNAEYNEAFVVLFSFLGAVIGTAGFVAALLRADDALAAVAGVGTALCAWTWAHYMALPQKMPVD